LAVQPYATFLSRAIRQIESFGILRNNFSGGILSLLATEPLCGIEVSFCGGKVFLDGASGLANVDKVDILSPLVPVLICTLSVGGQQDFNLLPVEAFFLFVLLARHNRTPLLRRDPGFTMAKSSQESCFFRKPETATSM